MHGLSTLIFVTVAGGAVLLAFLWQRRVLAERRRAARRERRRLEQEAWARAIAHPQNPPTE